MPLTDRQCEIVGLIRDGHDTESIMEELDVSRKVVQRQVRKIIVKLAGDETQVRMPDIPALADRKGECNGC